MSLIKEIYSQGFVLAPDGNRLPISSAIRPAEGELLQRIIRNDNSVRHTLEVGCAYGLSSLHICEALRGRDGAKHIILDPYQKTSYHSIGIENLKREKYDFFEFSEQRSEYFMAERAAEGAQLDLIFIDGHHTLDQVIVECFFATRLLRLGGYLVLDDTDFPAIARVVNYLKQYPCYRLFDSVKADKPELSWKGRAARSLFAMPLLSKGLTLIDFPRRMRLTDQLSIVAFQKASQDTRAWNWYADL